MQSNPRPHADLICAWANGAEIQYYNDRTQEWVDIASSRAPTWEASVKYRISPEKKHLKGQYRVFLWDTPCGDTVPLICYDESAVEVSERHGRFKGWLTDWIKYDVIDPDSN